MSKYCLYLIWVFTRYFGLLSPMLKSLNENDHADASSGAKGLNFGQSLQLHAYFVHASTSDSGETGRVHSFVRTFA